MTSSKFFLFLSVSMLSPSSSSAFVVGMGSWWCLISRFIIMAVPAPFWFSALSFLLIYWLGSLNL
jgi:hypothetical protein